MDISIPLLIMALALLITAVVMTKIVTKKNVKKHKTEVMFGEFFRLKTETEYEKES